MPHPLYTNNTSGNNITCNQKRISLNIQTSVRETAMEIAVLIASASMSWQCLLYHHLHIDPAPLFLKMAQPTYSPTAEIAVMQPNSISSQRQQLRKSISAEESYAQG